MNIATRLALLAIAGASACSPRPEPASPTLSLTGAQEPGTKMIVSGRVFAADREHALAGVRILVYQTDASGVYGQDARHKDWARLHGWMQTDSRGRYELRTIRPGPYPGGGTPAHIHFVVYAPDGSEQGFELRFADDSLVYAGAPNAALPAFPLQGRARHTHDSLVARLRTARSSFAQVQPVTVEGGVQRVQRDFAVR